MEDTEEPGVASEEEGVELAAFSERVLAFSLDLALFVAGYYLSFRLAFPRYPLALHPAMAYWHFLWAALFVIYQAFFSSEGRASLGKKLLGLRVLQDGEGLGLGRAVVRSALYPVSAILGLGFLWSLLSRERQCWHDMAVGSVVIREKPFQGSRSLLVRAGAGLCLLVLAGCGMWALVWGPRYHRIMMVAYAKVGLREMAQLQQISHLEKDRYADDLFALAEASTNPNSFLAGMGNLMDVRSLVFENTAQGFTIVARALDDRHTVVRISGDEKTVQE
jgi:uncharacterized RDD family membrane protein YckC